APLVIVIVPLVPPVIVMLPNVIVEAFAVKTPLVFTVRFPPPETVASFVATVFASVKVPVMLRVLVEFCIVMFEPVVIVPEIVRLFHSLLVPLTSIFTVLVVPDRVTVPVPWVHVLPAPLVSQLPETVHNPVVTVIVPLVPPVIVILPRVTVEAFAVNTPLVLTVRLPPPETVASVVAKVFASVKVPVMLRVTGTFTLANTFA